ncbi:DNA repair protein RAD51 4 [Apis mellifera caucasica]|uniref:DNA repair protein RAD51 homolog 4 n=1 Tax=Apis mellifera TaxID=7460 RepID=A0A7M7L321_APIME|nr:DNA repair protein RAD51 homolog 4 [Apis mellifera]KAG6800203.1 DNA repair protein RAD51 4 [Apis mellifera caucasica]KAG9433221.1 DNA repair protein RAD51 4 [Apis mellifera carnica]|eukprot:XP_026295466.1 DNA repair protein RAD51 homolog 4 [Apis mellifera]
MTELSTAVNSKLSNIVIEQLQHKHICTVIQFIDEDSEKLASFTGLSLKDIIEIKRNICKKYGGQVKNAFQLFEIEEKNIISTNLSSLDNLLKGGLYCGQIYEICGLSASGKTQLCFSIAINIALKSNNLVRYIDTKRDFSGSRIEQILLKKNYNKQVINEIMERIKVCCVYNMHQLLKVLHWLSINLKEENEDCRTRIIIIDSLPALIFKFSKDHKTTIILNHLANICHFLAKEFNLSIISVNLISQWNNINEEGTSASSNENILIKPTLGKYWAHVPNTRLLLEKQELGNRKISIWNSFQLEADLACTLIVNDSGVSC